MWSIRVIPLPTLALMPTGIIAGAIVCVVLKICCWALLPRVFTSASPKLPLLTRTDPSLCSVNSIPTSPLRLSALHLSYLGLLYN